MFDKKFLSNGPRGTGCTVRSFYSNSDGSKDQHNGCISVCTSLDNTLLVEQNQDATKTSSIWYKLNPTLFRFLQSHFEEIFGASLKCDPFANTESSDLSLCVSRIIKNECYLIIWDPQRLAEVLPLIISSSIVVLIIVPDWSTHTWHKTLMTKASHRFVLPVGSVTPCWDDKSTSSAFILDTRYDSRASDLVTLRVPELEKLSLKSWPPRQQLSTFPLNLKAIKSHLNLEWFIKWGEGLPRRMWLNVLTGIKEGFPTFYRGRGLILRDYSAGLLPLEEAKAIEKAKESVAKGWALGPFERIPFPNFSSPMQAIVTKLFTIPKHKWINDGALRLIFHKSFPRGESINSITPRHDAASYFPKGAFHYLTLARLLAIITRAGRGCFIITFDAKDAYKQLGVRLEDLFQQVFKAGDLYYIDLCASFGALYGNDAYSAFAYVHCFCLAKATNTVGWLFQYVDNYILIVPNQGTNSFVRANLCLQNLQREVKASGLLTHEWQGPTHNVTFIGWDIDTRNFTVSITKERRLLMISFLEKWGVKATASVSELSSLIGLLIFLSQIIGGIKATIGILILERTALNRATRSSFTVSDRIRSALAHIAFVLNKWQGQSIIFDRCWSNSKPDITVYCDVAIAPEPVPINSFGKGAFVLPSKEWYSTPWTETELNVAMREKKHSSTHLELINMLGAVLHFAKTTQKVLCFCDSKSAVSIAQARYSATANKDIETLLRDFDVACCQRNLVVRFRWQSRAFPLPAIADALSRGQVISLPICNDAHYLFVGMSMMCVFRSKAPPTASSPLQVNGSTMEKKVSDRYFTYNPTSH